MRSVFLIIVLVTVYCIFPVSAYAQTIVVNSTGDEGDGDPEDGICDTGNADDGFTGLCTLRAAIQTANATGGNRTIVFNIGAGTPTIVTDGLPIIDAAGITIDGATGGAERVVLDGAGSASVTALWVEAGNTTIKNLIIHSFPEGGIILGGIGDAFGGNRIEGTWIGVNETGSPRPNGKLSLFIETDENTIGGSDESARNVIDGIGAFGSKNLFENNYIGTAPDGVTPLNADSEGLILLFGASQNVVRNNVISGAGRRGVVLWDAFENGIIENIIGLDKDGTAAVPNQKNGIYLEEAAGNIIGGQNEDDRNVISGNGEDGVAIFRKLGDTPLNVIAGNYIGTGADGENGLRNEGHGVHIRGASNNLIGREFFKDIGAPNIIAYNGGDGVRVVNAESIISSSNAILSNSIHSNDGLGIDLGGDGVTPNDLILTNPPNQGQNFPVITSARVQNGTTVINGFLQMSPSDEFLIYTIELFANSVPDPSEHGQGEIFLGWALVSIDEFGRGYFSFEAAGEYDHISATATDQNTFDTSEFAKHPGDLVVTEISDEEDADLTDGVCDSDPGVIGDRCTLRAAIQQAIANYDAEENNGDRQRITFNIEPSPGGFTITPLSPLPQITVPVSINALTQPGARCQDWPPNLIVELDGSETTGNGLELWFDSDGSEIRGLAMGNFSTALEIWSDNNAVACNLIGTDRTGTERRGNVSGITVLGASNNTIGGDRLSDRNLISGSTTNGIFLVGNAALNKIYGNYIGVNVDGTSAMGNSNGVLIDRDSENNRIGDPVDNTGSPPGNVISGNANSGIEVQGNGNTIQGNLIGTGANGQSNIGNGSHGVYITGGSFNTIGMLLNDFLPGAGNRIAHNGDDGIRVGIRLDTTPTGNTILGNGIFANSGLGIDLGGDGLTPGKMNTGQVPTLDDGPIGLGLLHTMTTIAENAAQLDRYIEGVREMRDAEHVDIVAGSMGGLISRRYIDRLMSVSSSGEPVVKQLVMLGTPNLGSPCADLYMSLLSVPRRIIIGATTRVVRGIPIVGTAIDNTLNMIGEAMEKTAATNLYQLTTDYVQETFNREISDQRGIPFHAYAGDPHDFTCHAFGAVGDAIVSVKSAVAATMPPVMELDAIFTNAPVWHKLLNQTEESFVFTRRLLSITPGGEQEQAPESTVQRENDIASPAGRNTEPQIIASIFVPILPGEPTLLEFPISEANVFGAFSFIQGGTSIRSTVRDPAGGVVDEIDADTSEIFLTHNIQSPEDGIWTIELEHALENDTLYIPFSAWQYGGTQTLDIDIDFGNPTGTMHIQAALFDNGEPVPDAEVVARIVTISDSTATEMELFDDGEHGDGEANDGTYANETEQLPPGIYAIGVWALFDDLIRSATQIVHFPGGEALSGVNLSLSKTSSPDMAETGEDIVYTLSIYNAGPDSATGVRVSDPLPEGMTFVSSSTTQGSCAEENGIVHCELGELAVEEALIVEITATASEPGLYMNEATVSADQRDWNPSLNSSSAITEVVISTGVDEPIDIPDEFALHQAYPNPFNATTVIPFDVKDPVNVVLEVFDILGRRVELLADDHYSPGRYSVVFNAHLLTSGIYIYRIQMGSFTASRKAVFMK